MFEKPRSFRPFLDFLYENQQQRLNVIADEMMQTEEMINVSSNVRFYDI
jgi:hypothetical protein